MSESNMTDTGAAEPLKCDRYYTDKNQTFLLYGGYEGIPENLLLNIIIWALLLLLFSVLRKIAWDYGRIALVSRSEASNLVPVGAEPQKSYNVWTSLFYGEQDEGGSQESLDTHLHHQDKGFCSWIPAFFSIKDEHILQKSGKDAVQYLKFQRYLMVYMAVIVVLSIGVILPCNFQGDLEGDKQAFGHTTISNVNANSLILWVHSIFSVLYLVIAIFFMRHFSLSIRYEEDDTTSRTLMVFNIPKHRCSKNLVVQHFQEAYPDLVIQDVQFAYNISKLVKLDHKREVAAEGLANSEAIQKQTGERPMMTNMLCGELCCDCCKCKKVDCIDYYTEEMQRYHRQCEHEKVWAFRHTLGIAFVTFENEELAFSVLSDFAVSCKGAHSPQASSISKELSVHNWEVVYAPRPGDIYWQNLSIKPYKWWLKAIFFNTLLFIVLFFLTTPSIILNLLSVTNYQEVVEESFHSPLLVQFLPTLMLWIVSALLPNLVYYVDYYFIGHWTRTSEHHAVMRKTFYLLLLMVLVLPSLGLTSAKALVEWLYSRQEDIYKFRWECIFIPDNGAFFVNYVITTAFIGNAVQLVRIPQLLLYAIKLACARSAAERTTARKSVLWEYQFGSNYAWMLCVFTVTMVYSIPCPLITPFGLIYLIMKHLVDRYNIYFAYQPSKIDQNIHSSAVNFVIIAVILLQAFVLFFVFLRANTLRGMIVFLIISFLLTLFVLFGRCCFGWFSGLSPLAYKKMTAAVPALHEPTAFEANFIPSVLRTQNGNASSSSINNDSTATRPARATSPGYGTMDETAEKTPIAAESD